jgi:hypothetical protein
VLPGARPYARLGVAPGRRPAVRWGQRRNRRRIDRQVDSTLVQRGDLIGGHELPLAIHIDHDPMKDVELRGSDDVLDGTHLVPSGGVDRHTLVEHLVCDRETLVYHGPGPYRPGGAWRRNRPRTRLASPGTEKMIGPA